LDTKNFFTRVFAQSDELVISTMRDSIFWNRGSYSDIDDAVRMAQLWPLVRRYGPEAVAAGLGISAGALGTLLSPPEAIHGRGGRRGRGRGISARDVKTTRRTLKAIKKLYFMMPTRRASSAPHRHYYRRRR